MESSAKRALILKAFAQLALSLWWGGLTFYAAIVVPIGSELLSNTTQGFITQQVTHWLNGACLLALVTTLVVLMQNRSQRTDGRGNAADFGRRKTDWALWSIVAVSLVALFFVHRSLSAFLDVESMSVSDSARFYAVHRWYLLVTTLQWLAGTLLVVRFPALATAPPE